MPYLLKLKMLICKILTFWIPKNIRKNVRNFLFYFSFTDFIRFKNANYYFVSLGDSCLTRSILTAIKLKPRKIYGEKTGPFDLCINPKFNRITELIQNDFTDFFDNLIVNKELFPHDYKLTKKQFEIRYKKRIKNFLDIQKSDKMIYYVYSHFGETPQTKDVENLYKVLKKKRNGKPFKIILLISEKIDVQNVIQINDEIVIDDRRANEYILNIYNKFNNKYTKLRDRMKNEFYKIIFHP